MAVCATCGNEYERTFDVLRNGKRYTFDCFECAIHKLAPSCLHCGCRVIGHGIDADDGIYCCAHCAQESGYAAARDRVCRSA